MKQNYFPKAGRCRGCTDLHLDCKHLPFSTMPVHRRDGSDVTVICTQYKSASLNDEQRR